MQLSMAYDMTHFPMMGCRTFLVLPVTVRIEPAGEEQPNMFGIYLFREEEGGSSACTARFSVTIFDRLAPANTFSRGMTNCI